MLNGECGTRNSFRIPYSQFRISKECPAGVGPACPVWKTGAFAARPRARGKLVRIGEAEGEGVEPSRDWLPLTVFETAATASWLALPRKAAAVGIEPTPFTLTG